MSTNVREAVTIPRWKEYLVRKHFEKEHKAGDDEVATGNDIDAEFESIFSSSFIENYDPDEAFSKEQEMDLTPSSPQSLKELASLATTFNDSGYEGQQSGLKPRGSVKAREKVEEEEAESVIEGENPFFASLLELLKLYMVVVGLLYMIYMTDSCSGDEKVGGKKAAIKFYYDSLL